MLIRPSANSAIRDPEELIVRNKLATPAIDFLVGQDVSNNSFKSKLGKIWKQVLPVSENIRLPYQLSKKIWLSRNSPTYLNISRDGAKSFEHISIASDYIIGPLEPVKSNPLFLVATTGETRVYVSRDGGVTFDILFSHTGIDSANNFGLRALKGGVRLFTENFKPGGRIYRSVDCGLTWAIQDDVFGTAGGPTEAFGLSSVDFENGYVLTYSVFDDNLLISHDYGATWIVPSISISNSFFIDVCCTGGDGNWVASKVNRRFCSFDFGLSWSEFPGFGLSNFVRIKSGVFVASGYGTGKIYRSTDGGVNWVDTGRYGFFRPDRLYKGKALALDFTTGNLLRVSADNIEDIQPEIDLFTIPLPYQKPV